MTTNSQKERPLFPGLEPSGPPSDLKDLVLNAVGRALEEPMVPDRWTRIWNSTAARVAWAATVILLIVAHLALPPRHPSAGVAAKGRARKVLPPGTRPGSGDPGELVEIAPPHRSGAGRGSRVLVLQELEARALNHGPIAGGALDKETGT